MGTRYLDALLNPASIVLIGASERQESLGGIVLRNLMVSGYAGRMAIVNRRDHGSVHGVPCFRRVRYLDFTPSLAILCTPAETIPALIRELGEAGVHVAIVMTGGMSRTRSRSGRPLMLSLREIAQEYAVRVLGPETIGVIVPQLRLNATFMHMMPQPGKIAFIGQSGSIASAIIDWARHREIGFSLVTTLGDGFDIHIDDLIDYLAQDGRTRGILLHIETIESPRRFVSAVRAISRGKPVIVVKSGRYAASQWQPRMIAPGLGSEDPIYDAVFKRAGSLRVANMDEMFDALETLTRMKRLRGGDLHILSNGFGPAVLAIDALFQSEGKLGDLDESTWNALATIMPSFWRPRNPVELHHSASPALWRQAIEIISADTQVHNLLIVFSPTLTEDSLQIADTVIDVASRLDINIMTCWMGHSTVYEAREAFYDAGVPSYTTPDKAIRALMHTVRHARGQRMLRETPNRIDRKGIRVDQVRGLLESIAKGPHTNLSPQDGLQILQAWNYECLDTVFTTSIDAVQTLAEELGSVIQLRLVHEHGARPFKELEDPYLNHEGVTVDLNAPGGALQVCQEMLRRLEASMPESRYMGYAAQPVESGGRPVVFSIGITRDPVFGPLILVGASGNALNRQVDRQVGLPPLNGVLARDLISQSYMARLLRETYPQPDAALDCLVRALINLSRIVVEHPTIACLEIDPFRLVLSADNTVHGLAEYVRVSIGSPAVMTIQPYPSELIERVLLPKSRRRIEIRPVRGEDEPAHIEFHQRLSPESIRYRYFHYRKSFTHDELAHMLQLDYDREMAFMAVDIAEQPANSRAPSATQAAEVAAAVPDDILGVVRTWTDPNNQQCEFAIILADSMKGEGLGWILMQKIIEYSRERGTLEMVGSVLPENEPMLRLARKLGFSARPDPEEDVIKVTLSLNEEQSDEAG